MAGTAATASFTCLSSAHNEVFATDKFINCLKLET